MEMGFPSSQEGTSGWTIVPFLTAQMVWLTQSCHRPISPFQTIISLITTRLALDIAITHPALTNECIASPWILHIDNDYIIGLVCSFATAGNATGS